MRKYSLNLAWIISIIATLGSLFFSEVLDYPPCDLCWYQRIFMYPLTIILGIAVFKKAEVVVPYVLPLPFIGFFIALYQYIIQNVPSEQVSICGIGISCTTKYITIFGFITLPFLSMVSFILIIGFLFLSLPKRECRETTFFK